MEQKTIVGLPLRQVREQGRYLNLMLESPLFVIDEREGPVPQAAGMRTLEAGMEIRIATLDIEGVPHTPIFSSLARLSAVLDRERSYLSIHGRQLLEIVQQSHLILNPGSQYGKQLVPEETRAMLSGEIFRDHRVK